MEVMVGIGSAGCAIVNCLRNEQGCEIYKIDSGIRGNRTCSISAKKTLQEFEAAAIEKQSKLTELFEEITEDDTVSVVLSGADQLAGASLIILEILKDRTENLDVIYLRPDREFLSEIKKRDDSFVRGVLQEFARSGSLRFIYLLDTNSLEEVLGDVPLSEYEAKLYGLIASTTSLMKFYNSAAPLLDNRRERKNTTRIATFGVSSFEKGVAEDLFYPLLKIKEKVYYYGMSKAELESDGSLLRKIKSHIKSLSDGQNKNSISFAVFETTYDKNMVLCGAFTDAVQE